MPKYLSAEWHKEFQRLWNDLIPDRSGASARTQNKITGGPDGDQAYYWVIQDGKLTEATVGESPDSEVTVTTGYIDSVKIQKGELDPNAAFMQGRMKVAGNVAKLMALLPLTNSPEYKQLQEQVREMSGF
jgi:putative sterol carrier protein